MALSDLRTLVDEFTRDEAARLQPAARDRALELAVRQYGKDRPRTLVADLPGGSALLDLPASWTEAESRALAVECPVGLVPPALLTADLFAIVPTPAGPKLRLALTPGADEAVRLVYTAPHRLDAVEDTIPPGDREAVAAYAAALLQDQLAAAASGSGDSTIIADSVNHGGKAAEFAARARALRQRYQELLGIDPKRTRGASATSQHRSPTLSALGRMFPRRRA
ncbi:MAG TPA: hypothetical protein VED40_10485 [Azospirillaceae bacterium]|nr:hypothetical protein [Azospirillaceae bacterium]